MNRKKAKKILEDGGELEYHAWYFTKLSMGCHSGCCDTLFDNVEETLDQLQYLCGGVWEAVNENGA